MLSGYTLMDTLNLKRGKIFGGAMVYERQIFPMYMTEINDMLEIKMTIKLRASSLYDKDWLYYDLQTVTTQTFLRLASHDRKWFSLKPLNILDIKELKPDQEGIRYVIVVLKGEIKEYD